MSSTMHQRQSTQTLPADRSLWDEVRLAWRLLRDPRVGGAKYLLPCIAVLYLLSPVDLLPDFVPIVGQIDDLGALVLMMVLLLRSIVWMAPSAVVAEHRQAIGGSPAERLGGSGSGPIYDVPFRVRDRRWSGWGDSR